MKSRAVTSYFCDNCGKPGELRTYGMDIWCLDCIEDSNPLKPGYCYRGYVYDPYIIHDDDCEKTLHYVRTNGAVVVFDWSPNLIPSRKDFRLWVDLGCPGRLGISALDKTYLQMIKLTKGQEDEFI